jgi:anti-anti-sigma factor
LNGYPFGRVPRCGLEGAFQTPVRARFLAVVSATELNIRKTRGDRVVVELRGEHEAYTAAKLEQQLDALVDAGYGIVIDLRNAQFIDSTTAGLFIAMHRPAEKRGSEFSLLLGDSTGWPVRRLLDVTGLGSLLNVADYRH